MDKKGAMVPLALGVGAAVFYVSVLASKERALVGRYETGKVFVARVDIPERSVLREDMLETLEMPRRFMAQDAVESRVASDVRIVTGLVNRVRIPKGDQIEQSSLISVTADSGIALRVPPGYRAAVLPVDAELKTLIKPGDRVDVLVTMDAFMTDGRREKVTATILQNILVISVGGNLGQGMNAGQAKAFDAREEKLSAFSEKATIGLALNPEEFQYLALSQKQGETTVGVRAPGDHEIHVIQAASMTRLFNR